MLERSCQFIWVILGCAIGAAVTSCRSEMDPAVGGDPSSPTASAVTNSPLPARESGGLRAEADFGAVRPPAAHTHALDLRLTNLSDSAKKNIGVENVVLAGYHGGFRRPPTQTLWHRGSSASYPAIATWHVKDAPGTIAPLTVTVRYEDDRGSVTVATFRWDVRVEPWR